MKILQILLITLLASCTSLPGSKKSDINTTVICILSQCTVSEVDEAASQDDVEGDLLNEEVKQIGQETGASLDADIRGVP